jgi:Peptidase family M13
MRHLTPLISTLSDVYKACMDEERIERTGLGPLLDMLKQLGGWPVLSSPDQPWDENNFDWMQTVYRQYLISMTHFLINSGKFKQCCGAGVGAARSRIVLSEPEP